MGRISVILFLVLVQAVVALPPPGGGLTLSRGNFGRSTYVAPVPVDNANLLKEDFEGTGNPGSWGTVGTVNFDYTTTVLDGSQSLFLGASQSSTSTNWNSGKTEMWGYFQFRIITTLGTPAIFEVEEQFATGQLTIDVNGSNLRVCDGSCASTTFGGMAADTKFHCWWHYKQVVGANNDTCEIWVDTVGTKPATGGTKYATITTGAGDSTIWIAEWFNLGGSASGIIFDHVRLSTIGDLGDNPP